MKSPIKRQRRKKVYGIAMYLLEKDIKPFKRWIEKRAAKYCIIEYEGYKVTSTTSWIDSSTKKGGRK